MLSVTIIFTFLIIIIIIIIIKLIRQKNFCWMKFLAVNYLVKW